MPHIEELLKQVGVAFLGKEVYRVDKVVKEEWEYRGTVHSRWWIEGARVGPCGVKNKSQLKKE